MAVADAAADPNGAVPVAAKAPAGNSHHGREQQRQQHQHQRQQLLLNNNNQSARPPSAAASGAGALLSVVLAALLSATPASCNELWIPGNPLGDTSITFNLGYIKDGDQPWAHDNVAWQLNNREISYPDCMNYVRGKVPASEVDLIVWIQGSDGGCYIKKYDSFDGAAIIWGGDQQWVLPNKACELAPRACYFADSSYGQWYTGVSLDQCANTCLGDGTRCAAAMYFPNNSCIMKGFNYPTKHPNQYIMFPWWQWSSSKFIGTVPPTAPDPTPAPTATETPAPAGGGGGGGGGRRGDDGRGRRVDGGDDDDGLCGVDCGDDDHCGAAEQQQQQRRRDGCVAGRRRFAGGGVDGRRRRGVGARRVRGFRCDDARRGAGGGGGGRGRRDAGDVKVVADGSGAGGKVVGAAGGLYPPGHASGGDAAGGGFGIVGRPGDSKAVEASAAPAAAAYGYAQPPIPPAAAAQVGYDRYSPPPPQQQQQPQQQHGAGGYGPNSGEYGGMTFAAAPASAETGMWVSGGTAGASAQSVVQRGASQQIGYGQSEKTSAAWRYNNEPPAAAASGDRKVWPPPQAQGDGAVSRQPTSDRKAWPVPEGHGSASSGTGAVASSSGELFPPAYSESF
ncbi:hypothetical protein DFJ73DRAFT_898025 [Zopfochytrium polystomum]|nr:hypothetical protein DFJ73DRAFT_898025 [Zopfochytrium polystomum]